MLKPKQTLESLKSSLNSKKGKKLMGNFIKYKLSWLICLSFFTGVIFIENITFPQQISSVQAQSSRKIWVSVWKRYKPFKVPLGNTMEFVCDQVTYGVGNHIIPLWKKVRGEWKLIANIKVPYNGKKSINTNQLGVGEFAYRNPDEELSYFNVIDNQQKNKLKVK